MSQNLENQKGVFPVKAKIELENLKAAVCCYGVSVFLFTEII